MSWSIAVTTTVARVVSVLDGIPPPVTVVVVLGGGGGSTAHAGEAPSPSTSAPIPAQPTHNPSFFSFFIVFTSSFVRGSPEEVGGRGTICHWELCRQAAMRGREIA